jgi:Spy/CpxP family protein refolding chaperone
MFGFLIGTACLIGLIKVARHGRGGCGYGYSGGGSCGGSEGYEGRHGGFGRRGGWGPRMFLRGAFERLDTTPGQEKVIVQAIDELKEIFAKARGDFKGTRQDFANVIRGETLDEASVADIFMKHDTTISETRRAAVESLRKIHDALTEKQRAQVADFLEKGPGFGPGGGGDWGRRGWGRHAYRGTWT